MGETTDMPVQEQPKLSVDAFAAKIKAKYPDYANIDNADLVKKIVTKYPDYNNQIDYSQKKSPVGNALPNGVDLSGSGLNPFQSTQPHSSGVFLPGQEQAQPVQQEPQEPWVKSGSIAMKKYWDQLSPDEQKSLTQATQQSVANHANESISATPLSEQGDYAYSQTLPGKIQNSLTYLAQKATKGGLQVLKGAAYLTQLAANSQKGLGLTDTHDFDQAFNTADKATNFLPKTSENEVEKNKTMSNLGGLAEFLPAAAAAEGTGGATLYLQGMGQGKEIIDNAEANGAKINPTVKAAFILGTGGVNGLLMGDLGHGIFNSLGASLKDDVVKNITMNAIKEAAGKDITAEGFTDLLKQGAKEWGDKALQGGVNFLKNTKKAVTDLSALNAANFALKKGVDLTNDQPVFNENLGTLADQEGETLKAAPLFGAVGSLSDISKLTPLSQYKNAVLDNLIQDSSDANIAKTKQFISEHGQQEGWTPEEISATNDHVDKLATITKAIPKGLPNEKASKAVDLVIGRNDLQKQLDEQQAYRAGLTAPFNEEPSPGEQLLQNKIDQANDKLRTLATGKRATYSKGTEEDEGTFYKTVNGVKEEIPQDRYDLETLERPSKNEQPEPNKEVPVEAPAEPAEQVNPFADDTVNEEPTNNQITNPQSNESKNDSPETGQESEKGALSEESSGQKSSEKGLLSNSGEANAEPELSHIEADRKAIENETDPNEIAARYHTEQGYADTKEKAIMDYFGNSKINERDYNRYGDRNRLDAAKKLRWIDSKNSDGTGLDVHSEIISHEIGQQVTPEDIIDVIDKYKGVAHFNEENKSDIQKLLEQRYEELTGNKLTLKRAESAFIGKFNATPKELSEVDDLLKDHGFDLTTKDLEDYENKGRNTGSEDSAPAGVDAEDVSKAGNDSVGNAGETGQSQPVQSEQIEQPEGGEDVKKTILTKRAYEGSISADVKTYLEEKGLTRKSFSQEERSKQATDFINKFGEDAARMAIETGDIDGGMAASILAQLQIKISREMRDLPLGSDEREEMAKKQSDLIALMEKKGYLGGEFNGQLAHEYQNAELDYANVKRQVEKLTNKPLTESQDKKVKEITAENELLKTKLQEAEAKLIDETDKAFESGKEAAKNETKSEKAKRIADKLRKSAKIHRPGVFSSATPASLIWDTAIEVTAKSIEIGGKLTDAIEAGLEHIRQSEWYKSLSDNKKTLAEKEFKDFNNNNSGSTDLVDLQERFVDKKGNKFTPDEAKSIWGYMKQTYLENGFSYRDGLAKTANDLGLSWRQVSEAITTPKTKRMSDEMWKRISEYSRNRSAVKNWIADQNKSVAGKALQKVSGLFRGISVFGHGGIFIGTHAGMTLFNPSMWNKTIPAFFRGWKFAYGNEAEYQRGMEELKNSSNYLIAERAGLKNNPERINTEEYQRSQKYLGKLGMAGERGFNAIKVLRQDLFDYHFNKLSPDEQDDPEVAKSIAHLVNLATGATNVKLPNWVNEVSFAGGMEASRWEKLTASPAKATQVALNALFNPSKASTADRVFAKVWARRAGEQVATYTAVLLANAAIQNTINPKNKVNMTHPDEPDFLKFKFGDVTIDPTSGMRSTAMFMKSLAEIPFADKKDLHGDKRAKVLGKDIAGYARGKLSPFYSTAADVFESQDFSGNTMPYSNEKPSKHAHKLTWTEYAWGKAPLPVAEAAQVFYASALEHGAHKTTLDNVINGIMSGAISGTTGFRVGEYDANDPKNKTKKPPVVLKNK